MIAVFVILLFAVYLAFFFPLEPKEVKTEEKSPKYTNQMKKLWQVAQTSMKERKPFRAEKALLTILKFDEKNAAAYNRLGILYAKGKKYDEAVECFEIAQSLDNNPASIHNVGLIYLEIGDYEKAAMAFRQAISLEGDVPSRYIALAKSEEKLGNNKKAIEALENAFELDPKVSTLRQILAIYEDSSDSESATITAARIEEQVIKDNAAKKKRAARRVLKTTREPASKRSTSIRKNAVRASTSTKVASSNKTVSSVKNASKIASKPVTKANRTTATSAIRSSNTVTPTTRTNRSTAPRIIKPHVGKKRV